MYTVFVLVLVYCTGAPSSAVTVHLHTTLAPDIDSKTKIKLSPPVVIPAELNEYIIFEAPILNNKILYYLYKPNGQARRLNIKLKPKRRYIFPKIIPIDFPKKSTTTEKPLHNYSEHDISIDDGTAKPVKFIRKQLIRPIIAINNRQAFNLKAKKLDDYEYNMKNNEFLMGPLQEEDHGEWVLRLFDKDEEGQWLEWFQVITVLINEEVPGQYVPPLVEGDNFELRFGYSIKNITRCHLTAPRFSADRIEGSYSTDKSSCSYYLKNATKRDSGLWKLTGVGKLVYNALFFVNVEKKKAFTYSLFFNPRKTKIALKPVELTAKLNDYIILSAPLINKNIVYYLYNPHGQARKLDIKTKINTTVSNESNEYIDHFDLYNQDTPKINVKYMKTSMKPIIYTNYKNIFNLEDDGALEEFEVKMNGNDFLIGPLSDADHGNWVLSLYDKDSDGQWMEWFQVISIIIQEIIPAQPIPILSEGDSFEIRFAYPIHNLTACELTAPRSAFDRFFERSGINMDACSYTLRNVTLQDRGFWTVSGVGKIVYVATGLVSISKETKGVHTYLVFNI